MVRAGELWPPQMARDKASLSAAIVIAGDDETASYGS